ncbi:MAG: CoA-binding protein [Sulfolobales archaeon]|nr:CoA-binding protein [Sulfolobales archaeon]
MSNNEVIEKFFYPSSVAVVGASREPSKVGYQLLHNLIAKYRGKVYPINPKVDEILGIKAYPNVNSVPGTIDLAVISVPAPAVPTVVEECGLKGVKSVIIISAGFKELGTSEGIEFEKRIISTAKRFGIRVIGPNCMGVYVPKVGLNTTFLNPERMDFPNHGNIAFISQSGAFGIAVLDWAAMRGIGISKFVSLGNKCDVDESDLLNYLVSDDDTQVITMYVEGVEKGREFAKSLRSVTTVKPVVILKAGRSEEGVRAIASHTGSLAGADVVYDVVFRQFGAIRAMGMDELFDIALSLSLQPPAKGMNVGILTVGGGSGVMATDAAVSLGLKVPKLSDTTVSKLRKVLLPIASPYNPVDVTGSARDEHLLQAVEILTRSGEVDIIIWIPYFMAPGISKELAKNFITLIKSINNELDTPIPIVGAATGGRHTAKLSTIIENEGIPMYPSVERAAKAAWALCKYGQWLRDNGTFEEYISKHMRSKATN